MKSKRIILGNPLIAITMLKHDMTAGLAVPVELLVLEKVRSFSPADSRCYILIGKNADSES